MSQVSGRSVFTAQNICISIEDGVIASVLEMETEADLPFISPGFMDTQVNGYKGLDYSSKRLGTGEVLQMVQMLAASGTTRHFPTIITNPPEIIDANLRKIDRAIIENPQLVFAIPGIHVEGPYISSLEGPRGTHNLDYIKKPDYGEFAQWQAVSGGRIKQLTLAPELPGSMNFISKVSSEGVVVSIGHSGAAPEIIREAIAAGATMSTHLGNGSSGMLPRLKNFLWEQLAADELTASIITDGFHLPPAVVKVMLRAKGLEKLILVSDIEVLGGMEPGIGEWNGIEIEVFEDGHLGVAGSEYLAGSGHLLTHSLAWLMNELGLSPMEAVPLCTTNPQKLFFPSESVNQLQPGDPADLTLFNWQRGDPSIKVLETWQHGRKVFSGDIKVLVYHDITSFIF